MLWWFGPIISVAYSELFHRIPRAVVHYEKIHPPGDGDLSSLLQVVCGIGGTSSGYMPTYTHPSIGSRSSVRKLVEVKDKSAEDFDGLLVSEGIVGSHRLVATPT